MRITAINLVVILSSALSTNSIASEPADSWQADFTKNFINSCLEKQLSDKRSREMLTLEELRKYCACSSEYVLSNFNDADMEIILRTNSYDHLKPVIHTAYNNCSAMLLETRGLLPKKVGQISNSEASSLHCQAIQSDASRNPFMSSLSGSLSFVVGAVGAFIAESLDWIGFSNASRGLRNDATKLLTNYPCYEPPQLSASNINKTSDIFSFLAAHLGKLLGLLFIPATIWFLFSSMFSNKKDKENSVPRT